MTTVKSFIEGQLNACLSILSALTIGQASTLSKKQHITINLSKRLLGLAISSLYDGFELKDSELLRIEQALVNMSRV